jgi:hypothetical protein
MCRTPVWNPDPAGFCLNRKKTGVSGFELAGSGFEQFL